MLTELLINVVETVAVDNEDGNKNTPVANIWSVLNLTGSFEILKAGMLK